MVTIGSKIKRKVKKSGLKNIDDCKRKGKEKVATMT